MEIAAGYELCRSYMNSYGLGYWKIELDRSKRRLGRCNHTHKTISLSIPFIELNDKDEVLDVILHEIAHALAGPGHGHDSVWRQICIDIGARPQVYNITALVPAGVWQAQCGMCGNVFHKHRLVKNISRWCGRCGRQHGMIDACKLTFKKEKIIEVTR
jgi:predicted SprT family Zn-dependent metalloprotease